MKRAKGLSITLIGILFVFSFFTSINVTVAREEDFAGIDENEAYIWKVDFDDDVFTHWAEDFGVNLQTTYVDIEDYRDFEAIKIEIIDVDREVEGVEYELVFLEKTETFQGVDIEYEYYETENYNPEESPVNWEIDDKDDYFLFEFNDELYMDLVFDAFNFHFLDTEPNWDAVVVLWNDYLSAQSIGGDARKIEGDDGILLTMDESGVDRVEIMSEYDSDGILDLYEFIYDGETLLELEYEGVEADQESISEETLFFVGTIWLIIAVVAIGIMTLFIVRKKRKRKEETDYYVGESNFGSISPEE